MMKIATHFRIKITGAFLLCAVLMTGIMFGQNDQTSWWSEDGTEEPDTTGNLFQKGINLYNTEKYFDALTIFQKISIIPASSNRFMSATQMMLIKTYFRLGESDISIVLGKDFEKRFPDSNYLDDVRFTLAEIDLSREKTDDAIIKLLDVLKISDDPVLIAKTKQTIDPTLDIFISTEALKTLRDSTTDNFQKNFLTLKLAEKYHAGGNNKFAKQEMDSMSGIAGNIVLVQQFNETEKYLKSRQNDQYYIGVILPLSGSRAEVGSQVLRGVRFALNQFRQTNGKKISAIVLDNQSDMAQSIRQVQFLAKNPRVLAIFGPISSENAIAIAVVANQSRIPMITPTATASRLTSMGPYIFQANLDFENMGGFLGKYAWEVSRVQNIATLSPADEFGKEITDAFCKSIDESGGKILTQQWYSGEPDVLKSQLLSMRQIGKEIKRERLADKIRSIEPQLMRLTRAQGGWRTDITLITKRFDQYEFYTPDTIYYLTPKEALISTGLMASSEFEIPDRDSIQYPIDVIDGILLPSQPGDTKLIVPQMNYYNVNSQLFGSGNWYDQNFLKNNREFAARLKFISDYYLDIESKTYKTFVAQYTKLIGSAPNRFDLYGYDTMTTLLGGMKGNELSRESVKTYLAHMPVYNGISRKISFQGNRPRVNSCAFILGFENDVVRPVAFIENGNIVPVKKN
ncbi:MAG: penicillin-binding protein activator [Candidatus Marinimicrobia bacterium]|nr:penicillin-binding protein activator [Candidatus Neomarinimicrobiota bacterium]